MSTVEITLVSWLWKQIFQGPHQWDGPFPIDLCYVGLKQETSFHMPFCLIACCVGSCFRFQCAFQPMLVVPSTQMSGQLCWLYAWLQHVASWSDTIWASTVAVALVLKPCQWKLWYCFYWCSLLWYSSWTSPKIGVPAKLHPLIVQRESASCQEERCSWFPCQDCWLQRCCLQFWRVSHLPSEVGWDRLLQCCLLLLCEERREQILYQRNSVRAPCDCRDVCPHG